MRKPFLSNIKRVVIKVGSYILASPDHTLNTEMIRNLVSQVAALKDEGMEIIIVSSGAIAAGIRQLGLPSVPQSMPKKQAAAAVGQSILIWEYERNFQETGHQVAQVLLTHDDLATRRRFLNAKNTLEELLSFGVIPIINENDTVSVDEIKMGDNDLLSATVATMAQAQLLIVVSDVEGLYTGDPTRDKGARLLSEVEAITPEIEQAAGLPTSDVGSGGMATKVQAAKSAGLMGIPTIIVSGRQPDVIRRALGGDKVGTFFLPGKDRLAARKHWLRYTLKPKGSITVDEGAMQAITKRGKSLLPSGIVKVEGRFEYGDAVSLQGLNGKEIGRGLSNYTLDELRKIQGHHTKDIEALLGYKYYDEVVHRDNLVLLDL
ncbi:MAG: glutamate 5-kinase [Nitrospinae bacterium]|nr:glutamate 5-kinase [Nitrospinota bacterium]